MFEIRYTVVDAQGTVSFVGPGHVLKMLVAACAQMPADLAGLLSHLRPLDRHFTEYVENGLAVFDEHHLPGSPSTVPAAGVPAAEPAGKAGDGVFRVVDAASRQASLQPSRAGVVVFNLVERRIVQIHNTYAEVQREGLGRLRREGRPVPTFYHYHLPATWRIVP